MKRVVNEAIAPTWCEKCGTKLLEQEIGFREQGSRYTCLDPSCPTTGLSMVVLGHGDGGRVETAEHAESAEELVGAGAHGRAPLRPSRQ